MGMVSSGTCWSPCGADATSAIMEVGEGVLWGDYVVVGCYGRAKGDGSKSCGNLRRLVVGGMR
jgi:hypothetical protein